MLDQTKELPQDREAERAVLACVLQDRDTIIHVAPLLVAEDFLYVEHQLIYRAVLALYEARVPPDLTLVMGELTARGKLEAAGGVVALAALLTLNSVIVHVEHYATLVKRAARARRVIAAGTRIVNLGYNPDLTAAEMIDQAQATTHAIDEGQRGREFVPIGTALASYFDKLDYLTAHQGEVIGVPTGFRDLDGLTGGFQKSDLIILAARPGVGKTAFGLGLACNAAKHGKRVAIFNMEMPVEQLVQRLLATETGIDAQRLRLGQIHDEDWENLSRAVGKLAELPIYIDDTSGMTITELRAKGRRLQAEIGVDFVQVDYLQLLHGSKRGDNRVAEVGEISRSLKEMARELDVPLLAMAQLSRSVDSRPSHIPILSDLRESGSIEQDADLVAFLYREELYDKETIKKGITEMHIAKHRNGPLGIVNFCFFEKTTRFADLSTYAEPD